MVKMFTDVSTPIHEQKQTIRKLTISNNNESSTIPEDDYKELKIGKIAQTVLRKILESGNISEEEINFMQKAEYSKQFFGLNYPLLAKYGTEYEAVRYYKNPVLINGERYMMCSQWFETVANNDRPYLIRWIKKHSE